MKALFDILSAFSFGFIFDFVFKLAKKYVLNTYINLVDHLRTVFFIWLSTSFCLLLFFSGFLFCHIALFIILPWSPKDKAFLILGLGIGYIFIAIFWLIKLHSKSNWHKISGINKMIDDQSRIPDKEYNKC